MKVTNGRWQPDFSSPPRENALLAVRISLTVPDSFSFLNEPGSIGALSLKFASPPQLQLWNKFLQNALMSASHRKNSSSY